MRKSLLITLFFLFCANPKLALAQNDSISSSFVDSLVKKSNHQLLYNNPYWKILLHYNGIKSIIDDKKFFFSENGRHDLKEELTATIRSIFKVPINPQDYIACKYPARFKWINKELEINRNLLPNIECNKVKEYLNKTGAKKVDLVFVSENINNLMSMMGHLFLKISGTNEDGNNVSHALGYFAHHGNMNKIKFVISALFGVAPGRYILEPYDSKSMEYIKLEKRNLWEYNLSLSQEQINDLMLYIWELKDIEVKYSFITHNCASALLYMLYSTNYSISKDDFSIFDSPLDLVKKLYDDGYIKKANIIPADNYKFRMIENNLSKNDKKNIKQIINKKDLNFNYKSNQEKANLMYATSIVLDYKLANKDISYQEFEEIDKLINKNNLPKNNLKYDIKNPLKKSYSSNINLKYRHFNAKNNNTTSDVIDFNFFPVYNDFSHNNSEYFNEFELKLANFEVNYFVNENKLRVNNVDIIKVKNIVPYDVLVDGISGTFRVNFERQSISYNKQNLFPNLEGGPGLAFDNFLNKNLIIYSLANIGYSYFYNSNIFYFYPEFGLLLKENSLGKLNLKYQKYFSNNHYKYEYLLGINQTFFISKEWNLSINYQNIKSRIEGEFDSVSFGLNYQF